MYKKYVALVILFLFIFSSVLYAKEDEAIQRVEPVIEILYPRNGFLSLSDQITIIGKVRFVKKIQVGEKVMTLGKDKITDGHEFKLKVTLENRGLNVIDIYYVSPDGEIKKQRIDIYYESMPKGREKILIGTEKFLKETQEYKEEIIKSCLILGGDLSDEEKEAIIKAKEKEIEKQKEKEKEVVQHEDPLIEVSHPLNGYLSLKEYVTFKVKTQYTHLFQIGEKLVKIRKKRINDIKEFEVKVEMNNKGLNVVNILYVGLDKEVHKQTINIYYEPMPKGREQILIGTEKYLKEMHEYQKKEERDYL